MSAAAPPTTSLAPPPGGEGEIVLKRYRIVRRLAVGGMGVVYLARIEGAEGFSRPAVIKRMLPELSNDQELVKLFVREAQILAGLRHPGIVAVLDFEAEPQGYLMALEYVHGYHVGNWLKFLRRNEQRFPADLAIHIVVQVLEALEYVHTQTDPSGKPLGIVHRDISPSNIVVDTDGHVRLLDFGVARISTEVTAAKEGEVSLKGKFPYLAPELLSQEQATPKSDVYAAGVVLHELLTGENEFKRPDATETLRRVLLHDLSSVEAVRKDAPRGLDAILRKATARDPADRYSGAGEAARALRALLRRTDADLKSELRGRARADFLGPLSAALGVTPLEELERAWREAPIVRRDPTAPTLQFATRNSDVPTKNALLRAAPPPSRWPFALLGLLAFAGLGVALFAVFRDTGTDPPPVVIVDRQRVGAAPDAGALALVPPPVADAGVAEPAPRDAGTAVSGPPTTPPATPPATPRPVDRAALLTRAFNRQSGALRGCFEQHTQQTEGAPQVSVRFSIRADGSVEAAELSPAALAGTSLGQCLEGVARRTQFGPQPEPITFRIPITVRNR
ncbi:MAG: serine/threonine protein kinase [Sandaracinaceae bacterium]|nr:serine/threonine protein kinase [Sandaracinaceae bacterium]